MSKSAIDITGFEAKFQANPDPWDYANSPFEAQKRRILRQACGTRPYGRGLELACANGETSKVLAPICLQLLAIDGSPSAVKEALRRTRDLANVLVRSAILPNELPPGKFDLIVASEIFYYLTPRALDHLLNKLLLSLAPGGRIVCLHHVIDFDDAACHPAAAQHRARNFFGRHLHLALDQSYGRFRVCAFDRSMR